MALFASLVTAAQDANPKPPSISLEEVAQRRVKLMEQVEGVIVIQAGKERTGKVQWVTDPAPGDGTHFFYLVNQHYGDALLVLHSKDKSVVLFTDAEKAGEQTGIKDVRPLDKFGAYIQKIAKGQAIYADIRKGLAEKIGDGIDITTRKVIPTIVRLREIKSEAEVKMIRFASELTSRAHLNAMRASRPGTTEAEIAKVIEDTFKAGGCEKLAFPTIVGSSQNSPIIHHPPGKTVFEDGDLLLADIGCSHMGYATDYTRTWPVNGKFTEKQRKAYEAVLASQKAAEKILKPGVTWRELHDAAVKALVDAGYDKTGYHRFHGLGHWVGLQTHDVGDYRKPIEEGMVLTIEPGAYDAKEKISVRIEDTYVVTKNGSIRLTDGCPREVDEIEKVMAELRK